jgi:hypothetical protein
MNHPRTILATSFTLLASLAVTGCPDNKQQETSKAAPSASAAATAPATASASATATPSASVEAPKQAVCTIDSSTVIDRGARGDTGLTAVLLAGNQAALGYATGGTPKVVVVDTSGKASQADVDWSHVKNQEAPKDATMVRAIHRVTPLGFKGQKMRVGMDIIDTSKDKNAARYLRCGAADQEPIVADDTPLNFFEPTEDDVAKVTADAVDVRDCRTFSNGEITWSLYTEVKRDGKDDNHDVRFEWSLDSVPGKGTIKEPVVDKRVAKPNKDKKYGTLDHFITPISVNAGTAGYMMLARDGGGLVFARRNDDMSRAGGPWPMGLPAGAGLPSLAHEGERVFLAVPEWNKTDLFMSSFMGNATPTKPEKVTLNDSSPATEGARDWPAIAAAADDSIWVTFIDGKSPKRRVRLTILGDDLKQRLADVFDVTNGDVNVSEARVIALAGNKAFVAYIDVKGDLTGAVVSCKK